MASNRRGKLTQEVVDRIREFYINNDLAFEEIVDNSVELFGIQLSIDQLKYHSAHDPKGKWFILKAHNGRNTGDIAMSEKLEKVADKLYELIIDDSTPAGSMAQLAKVWVDVVAKGKLDKSSTAKTSTQSVRDLIEKMEAEAGIRKSN